MDKNRLLQARVGLPACECITDVKALDALAPAWDALAGRSAGAHLYQSYPWISAWLRHIPEGHPRIFVAHRGDRLTAAIPFCAHYVGWGPLRLRTLRIVGDNADFCDVLSDPEYPDDLSALWSGILNRRDWHLIDLRYVRPDSHLCSLGNRIPASLRVDRRPHVIAPYLDMKEDWRETVSKGQRSDWLRRRRRLEERGKLSLTAARTVEEVDLLLDQFAAMHIARWKEKGETSSYHRPSFRAFLRESCHMLFERGHLRLYRLDLDGEAVSIGIYFLFERHLLPYSYTFSAAYAKFCPLHLLIMHVVEEMRDKGLADIHDFGAGDEEYKSRWTDKSLVLQRILIARSSLAGLAAFWWAGNVKPLVWSQARLQAAVREARTRWRLRKGL